eukprot:CAMPEP_0168334098 /NCGR_PEP_ID=MMETSP0213-20121227/10042_1 /TAXON_ID=151035 /ORGANISM="Euplotes harpa, Strain FSP1.4" /LENGTH=82 /DNA_ID=CAMNT_0008338631 /DNA_START=120 /DNA_END=368 /DNA_ORIENTATION=+
MTRRSIRFFSSQPLEIENTASNEDSAEAFPLKVLISEEMVRGLTELRRMKKIEQAHPKKTNKVRGLFPEIIFDARYDDKALQ